MTRMTIDCRDDPSQNTCSVSFSADSEEELMEAARLHALNTHKYPDTPQTWDAVRSLIKQT